MNIVQTLTHMVTPAHARLYRAVGGRGVNRARGGIPVLLLTTSGRRTGTPRTVPLGYICDGEDLVVIGSHAGLDIDPGWVHNLRARANAEVQVGSRRWSVHAVIEQGEERARLWKELNSQYSYFDRFQRGMRRSIPVVRLSRTTPDRRPCMGDID